MDNRDLEAIRADDALIDRLASGAEVQPGDDAAAHLLAELRDDTRVDTPEPPTFLVPGTERRSRPWAAGLVGAAAASMVIAVGGIAVHQSGIVDSPDEEVLVALSGKLEEAQAASDSGDATAVHRFLAQARSLLAGLEQVKQQRQQAQNAEQAPVPVTQTVTARPEARASSRTPPSTRRTTPPRRLRPSRSSPRRWSPRRSRRPSPPSRSLRPSVPARSRRSSRPTWAARTNPPRRRQRMINDAAPA